ncbi:MAG: hypothetical protein K2R93_21940 [Gemmatimonadaceae bacterium]|nr:hypothetical protein [Gemmatimonadaceae bacterium]
MRRVLLSLLLAAGCAGGATTEPAVATLSVRVRDDGGKAAGVNQVQVTTPDGVSTTYRTAANGQLTVRLREAGAVSIRVVPRAQFVGSTPGLARTITIDEGRTEVIDVTVYRLAGGIDYTPTGI